MNDLRTDTAAVGEGDQEEVAELQTKKTPFHAYRGIALRIAAPPCQDSRTTFRRV